MLVFSNSIKPVKSPLYEYLDISLSGENSHPYIVFLVEIIRTSYLKWIKRLITIESIEGGRSYCDIIQFLKSYFEAS